MTQPAEREHPVRDAYEVLEIRPDASQAVLTAAYRALAAVHHPDAPGGSTRRMAELNAAYAAVRSPDLRAEYDRARRRAIPVQPSVGASFGGYGSTSAFHGRARDEGMRGGSVMDFGRYEGWRIADLARRDPDYLRWLRRHSSGIRFRAEIDEVLATIEPRQAADGASRHRR